MLLQEAPDTSAAVFPQEADCTLGQLDLICRVYSGVYCCKISLCVVLPLDMCTNTNFPQDMTNWESEMIKVYM